MIRQIQVNEDGWMQERGQRLRFDAGTKDLWAETYCSRLTKTPKNA